MKKILFSCMLALGVTASAQYNFLGDFEGTDPVYVHFGGGTITAAAACSGSYGGQLAISATNATSGYIVNLDETGQISNGQKATLSISYKKAAGAVGNLYVGYFVKDDSNTWSVNPIGNSIPLTAAALTTCSTVTVTVPIGALDPDAINGVGIYFERTSGTGNVFVDNIKIVQDVVTTTPACTSFTAPLPNVVSNAGTKTFMWNLVANASNYKVTVGSTPGASDVFNRKIAGSLNKIDVKLAVNKTYYAKITANNDKGDAVGCQEITFTTNSTMGVCGPLSSTAPTAIAPIKSVNFAGVTKTSDDAATTIGSFSPYEDFTSTVFTVDKSMTSVPLTVSGVTNGNPANGWGISVFIDWNGDGNFDGAGEQYFNTQATKIRKAGVTDNPIVLTGNIAVPAGTTFGKKIMRVKYNFSVDTAIHNALSTGCIELGNGQAEDYTIDYKDILAVSDVNAVKTSLFPNPFKDILKISDIKGATSIIVSDISGRTVKTLAPATELQLGDLKRGMYIVTIKFENGTASTTKVIKE